jgi:TolB-like protein/DNA-binding winged helix-turn-helix (wHTH) protein
MDAVSASRLQFEGFTLDLLRRCVWQGDREVELRPKSFDVLCYLAERHGRLATKDEIIQAIWPDVIATDDSLARCISDVRHALDDSDQRVIKTVPGRGYVFAAPVTVAPDALSPAAAPQRGAQQATRWRSPAYLYSIALAALLGLAAAGVGIWQWHAPAGLPLPDRPSIAVLPFTNMSGDAGQDYFSDGIFQDLSTSLSKFGQLFVIASQSVERYKKLETSNAEIGRELGARYLLRGSVQKDSNRIRLRTQLIEARSERQLWSERYDAAPAEVFAIQDEITQRIVTTLVTHIDKAELEHTLRKPPENLDAYDYYLRGNARMKNILAAGDSRGERIAAARGYFERALANDPRYLPAMEGLAWTYFQGWYQPSEVVPFSGTVWRLG